MTFIFSLSIGYLWGTPGSSKNFFSRILINLASLDAELNADSEFQIEIWKTQNFAREKSDLLQDAEGVYFQLPSSQPSTNTIRKSEIHLVMYEITFPIRNT